MEGERHKQKEKRMEQVNKKVSILEQNERQKANNSLERKCAFQNTKE